MPAECTVCASGLRAKVESEALMGKTPTQIARGLDGQLTVSAIRRHVENHHVMPRLETPTISAVAGAASDLWSLYVGAETIRADALRRGDSATALRATRESALILSSLSKDYNITDRTQAEISAEYIALGRALWGESAHDIELVPRLLDHIRTSHPSEAASLDGFAAQIAQHYTKETP